ncbi:MAG: uroporphyrinogen-III synthase [Flavobacterium sp.]|nr:MAG: uroporphyrinogen-III synthase [Flavobacterium sp.]
MSARIVSTKRLAPNNRQYLLNAGLAVLEADLIGVSPIPFKMGEVNENLLFTSQNGFSSFLQNPESDTLRDRAVFCVGSKTKSMIEANGYTVTAFAEYAADLAEILKERYTKESFTFFSGNLRRDTLPMAMKEAGIDFNEIKVYETALTPHKINGAPDGIFFFSPSGVESYRRENSIGDAVCFCIGTTTAEALESVTKNIVLASKPTVENVIVQCINYYKK